MFASWSFGRRIAAGFLVSTLLTALMAAISVRVVYVLLGTQRHLTDSAAPQLAAIDRARIMEERRISAARGYILTDDPVFRTRYQESDADFERALSDYEALDPSTDTRRLVDGARRNYSEYQAEFRTTIGLRLAGRSLASVIRRYETVVEPQRIQADRILGAMVSREAAQFDEARAHADLVSFGAVMLIALTAVALVVLSGELALVVGRRLAAAHEQEREASAALAALKASQTALDELQSVSYAISHNLRAPLRAIDAAARSAAASAGAAEAGRLAAIRSTVGRMSGMIESLLELLSVSSGEVRREELDVSALAWEVFAARARDAPRRVEVRVQPGLAARTDARLLRLALEKLADNAVKFSSKAAAPLVEVGARGSGASRELFVRDNGAGFDLEHAERLFVPFQRLHRQDEFPGIGMGLPIARRAVERLGGTIRGEGQPGRGACFYLTLP